MTLGRMKQSKDETAHHADRYPSPSTSPPPPWGRLPTLVPVPCFLKTFAIGSFLVLSVLLLMEFDCLESRGERGCSGYRVGHLLGCDQHSWGGRGQLLGQVGQLFESGRQPLVFRQRQSQRRWHKDCHKVYLDQHFRMILFCFLADRPQSEKDGWCQLEEGLGEPGRHCGRAAFKYKMKRTLRLWRAGAVPWTWGQSPIFQSEGISEQSALFQGDISRGYQLCKRRGFKLMYVQVWTKRLGKNCNMLQHDSSNSGGSTQVGTFQIFADYGTAIRPYDTILPISLAST